ncbi:MAG: DUF5694 domain-containing protein [Acidobacteriota bacterium]|nr:DUF5694 domain-containing protein [Acidobacteriota bacterium]
MRKIFVLLGTMAIATASSASWAQSDARPEATRPEIMILGTYHMSNPGHDVFNLQADDVQSPKRQQEIAQLMEVLQRFRPTKIAIEDDVGGKRARREYSDYLAGKYTLSRNEIDQIGYRLAKELGHKAIYPVDVDGDFPLLRAINYAKANGRAAEFDKMQARVGTRVKAEGDFLRSHTVLETLAYMNSDAMAAQAMAEYFDFVPYGEPWEYAGPDLLAAWYQRNIRIYSNIVKLVESPNERILVIYGAGHLGWLRQDAANDQTVRLRKLAEFTGKQ